MRGQVAVAAAVVALFAITLTLAGPASADVSGINVSIGETSLTVTGVESDPVACGHVRVEVADQPSGAVYHDWKFSTDANWSLTFWGLQPGTTYAVRVTDDYCSPFAVPDPAWRQLFSWSPSVPAADPRPADRFGYCSVAGDTWPDGTPIMPGTFLNLLLDQPSMDSHYTGAIPAYYVEGVGITCSLTPAQTALAGTAVVNSGGGAVTLKAGGGGDVTPFGFYTYVPN